MSAPLQLLYSSSTAPLQLIRHILRLCNSTSPPCLKFNPVKLTLSYVHVHVYRNFETKATMSMIMYACSKMCTRRTCSVLQKGSS